MTKSSNPISLGWARVSTKKTEDRKEQTLDQQIEAIQAYGVPAENIYSDRISGSISLKESMEWAALSERAPDPKQQIEIVLVSWSRLSREFYDFLAAVNLYRSNGCVFKATKAALHYKKHVLGIRLGRPEKLTLEDCAEINRLDQLEDYKNPRLIAEEITAHRLAAIPEGLDDPERERAEKHAAVSRPIVYRYLALTGLAESDFMLIDLLKEQHGDDFEAIATDLTAARVAAIPEEIVDDEEAYARH